MEIKKVWQNISPIDGFYNVEGSTLSDFRGCQPNCDVKDFYATREQAESALAFAQISQIMKKWFNPFSKEEWKDVNIYKYCLINIGGELKYHIALDDFYVLAFRSVEDREEFISYPENLLLVKNYLMLD